MGVGSLIRELGFFFLFLVILDDDKYEAFSIVIRGVNETRQLASYSNSTQSKLGQNSTRLEMLTSRVEQLVTRLKKLARNSKIFCI